MYKLLTTTAIIIATASSASAWDNASDIINKLDTIYTNVDGGDEFDALQGNAGTGNNGQLNTFIDNVNKGVTHLTLEVNADKTITPVVNQGVTFQQIQDSSNDLINRVAFDLFVQDDTVAATYEAGTPYSFIETNITEGADGTNGQTVYENANNGLVGRKIDAIVGTANAANTFLTTTGTSTDDALALTNALGDETYTGVALSGVDVAGFHSNIGGLNIAITTASADFATNGFFGDVNTGGLSSSTLDNYKVSGFTAGTTEGEINAFTSVIDGKTYNSLADWASGTEAP